MKNKLIASYAALILLMLVFMGIYTAASTRRFYHGDYQRSMEQEAGLVAQLLPEGDLQAFADRYAEELELRLTLIRRDGEVLADSASDEALENHLSRPEVGQALAGRTGSDTRYSSTTGSNCLYVAVPARGGELVLRLAKPTGEIEQAAVQMGAAALFGALLCAVFAVVMSVLFTRRIIRPLDRLNDAVNEVAQGNYGKKIRVEGSGQVARLADSFNVMNQILTFHVQELAEQNTKLTSILNSMTEGVLAVDTRSRVLLSNPAAQRMFGFSEAGAQSGKNVYSLLRDEAFYRLLEEVMSSGRGQSRELAWALPGGEKLLRFNASPICRQEREQMGVLFVVEDVTRIRRLEQMRTDFVSNVSHELKTPLTSIIGFVDTLRAGAVEQPETARHFLDIISAESDRLYRLIRDILTLSSLESADEDQGVAPVGLGAVAREVDQILRPKAREKQLAFEIRVQDSLPPFSCNRDSMAQLLINLIDNAIKYTEHGSVIASISRQGDSLAITVADTGIGIPSDQLDRVFERFYRVDKGRSRSMGGTGLGLSIVKHIALLYQGSVSVSSESGRGSEFSVVLPYNRISLAGGPDSLPE